MKTLFLLPILLLSLLSTSCWGVDSDDLVVRDGLYYKKFTDTPFTGKVSGNEQGKMKNGKKEGAWVTYHPNGQLELKGSYKNGEYEGDWVSYWDTGQIKDKSNWKNNKREGERVNTNADGTVFHPYTGTYKNGKKITN